MSIFISVFVPFMIYALCCIWYFTLHSVRMMGNATKDDEYEQASVSEIISKQIVIALTFFMLSFEYLQIVDSGWDYFKERTNWVDQTSSILILFMILKHDYFPREMFNLKYEQLAASLVVLGTWYKIFYWMKLFNTPAFFINLLS